MSASYMSILPRKVTMQGRMIIATMITILFSFSIQASLNQHYYPKKFQKDYYNGKIQNSKLKEKLFAILDGVHEKGTSTDKIVESCPENSQCYKQDSNISYKEARKFLFGQLHLKKSGNSYFVKDVYCETEYDEEVGIGPGKIPDSNVINCEHTWPQSRFNPSFPKLLQKNDIHHLYPVNSRANSSRSNHILAMVNGRAVNKTCQTSRRGMAIGSSLTAFEPPVDHRGNAARALFYFSTRYKINIGPLEEGFLRQWHHDDPVDYEERKRNNAIFKIQNNRNPFIDEPTMVDDIRDF